MRRWDWRMVRSRKSSGPSPRKARASPKSWPQPDEPSRSGATRSEPHRSGPPACVRCCATGSSTGSLRKRSNKRVEKSPNINEIRIQSSMSGSAARIDHLGVAVRSIDQALKFYRDQLGLTVSLRETVPMEKVHAAMLPVGESRIELLEASEPDSVIAKFIEKRGEGLHHVALTVPDLNAAVDRLKAAGARLLNEPRAGAGGHLYVFIHPSSTGGVLLELIQQ